MCIFLTLVLVWFDFDTISVLDQVEPQALVLEPNLTGTETAQNKQQYNQVSTAAARLVIIL